jgi:hypothetical protein
MILFYILIAMDNENANVKATEKFINPASG